MSSKPFGKDQPVPGHMASHRATGNCACHAHLNPSLDLFSIVASLRVCEYALGAIDVANRLEHVADRSEAFREMAAPHMDTPDPLEALPEIRILLTHTIGRLVDLQQARHGFEVPSIS